MSIRVIACTRQGLALAEQISLDLRAQGDEVSVWCVRQDLCDGAQVCHDTLAHWSEQAFAQADALLFVSACGIAVRAIAPHVRDKLTDPAVVCVDETGRFAVSLLSGHVGGANQLARRVAKLCGGQAVITTATDANGCFAVDEWAAENGLALLDRDMAKLVARTLLEGGKVGLISELPVCGEVPAGLVVGDEAAACQVGISVSHDRARRPFAQTLRLVPRDVTAGVGCKRGVSSDQIARLVDDCLEQVALATESLEAVASIDVKADEAGLLRFAEQRDVPLRLYAAEQLAAVPGSFSSSEFVRKTVGVDNVCERAACAEGATLVLGRQALDGVTVALAQRKVCLNFGKLPQEEVDT